MIIPALFQAGEICWVGVRNPLENPEHRSGEPKLRPAILLKPCEAGWIVIGTTTRRLYESGDARTKIPSELWEDSLPGLPRRAGYLWGDRAPCVPVADIRTHIGWATPPLRALAVRPLSNVPQRDKNDFLRLRQDERVVPGDAAATAPRGAEPTDDAAREGGRVAS